MLRERCTNVRFISDAWKRLCTSIKTSYSVFHPSAMHYCHATSIIFAVSSLCTIHFLYAWNTQMTCLSICLYVQYTKDHNVSHNAMHPIWSNISSVTNYETLVLHIFVTLCDFVTSLWLLFLETKFKNISTAFVLASYRQQKIHCNQSNLIRLQMTLLSRYFLVNENQTVALVYSSSLTNDSWNGSF